MFEYKTVRCWTAAGTMEEVADHRSRGWELVSTHPRFVFLIPFFPILGEFFGLQALLRRDVAKRPIAAWSPNTASQPIAGKPGSG